MSSLLTILGRRPVGYLLRDFVPGLTPDEAAPIASPRTCVPGPGTATVTGAWYITSGKLTKDAGAAYSTYTGLTQHSFRPGICVSYAFSGATEANYDCYLRSPADNSVYLDRYELKANSVGIDIRSWDSYAVKRLVHTPSFTYAVYDTCLKYVLRINNTNKMFRPEIVISPAFSMSCGGISMSVWPAPWYADYGLAITRFASAEAGTITTHPANTFIEATWTPTASDIYELSVRRTDDDNRWIVRCDQANSTVKLIERNNGVETERSSAAQTWTVGTAYRIVAICDGNNIYAHVANLKKLAYNTAAFNNTATGAKTSHAVTELVVWPRYVTLPSGVWP